MEFILSVLAGVVANNLDSVGKKAYSKLKEYLSDEKINTLVEHRKNNDLENLKKEIENILEYNLKLKQELESLKNQKSVTQSNMNGNNFYAESNININYVNGNNKPKKP